MRTFRDHWPALVVLLVAGGLSLLFGCIQQGKQMAQPRVAGDGFTYIGGVPGEPSPERQRIGYQVSLTNTGTAPLRGWRWEMVRDLVALADSITLRIVGADGRELLSFPRTPYKVSAGTPRQEERAGTEPPEAETSGAAAGDTRLPPGVTAEQVTARAWSPDGEVLACFLQNQDPAAEGSIHLWRPGQPPGEVAREWRVTGFQWSPDGRYVLSDAGSSATRTGLLIEVASQEVIERFSFVGEAYWSEDSGRLLVARPRPITPPPAWEVEGTLDVAAYVPQTRKWFVFARGSHDYYLQPRGWDDRGYPVFEKVAFGQPGRRMTISVEEIVAHHLPRPFDPEILPDGLRYPGRWKGNVMPGLVQEMAQMGWRELPAERMGALRFFTKEVAGVQVKIGVLPLETGGPTEDRATTTVAVELWPVGSQGEVSSRPPVPL